MTSNNKQVEKQNTFMRNKQRGAQLLEFNLVYLVIAGLVLAVLSIAPEIKYQWNLALFQWDANTIVSTAERWKKRRPDFNGLNIGKLCTEANLSKSICGSANNGQGTNPFGGNWTIGPATNKALISLTGTMPNDTDRVTDISETMASGTRNKCIQVSGCSTIAKTSNSVTMTY
ncbi:conserved hypothetical protein [Vibrio nigripulchritudo FTn2]|uniref:hypothetical protein n=1 Tax=Vibrio nigripulchritudo TaxID=28173 RepID=UPI0003B1BC51|nr:hypothetical protein [Vibrio nigripulchritudo]CCN39735.1 conserved hypothetical protein [Vibrio nigripulchritudo FTn2]